MFDKAIIRTDNFIDIPPTSQNLYFHLGIEADDEGFVSPKMVMRMLGCGEDDLKVLIMKNFVIPFKSGVVVITDWKENNYLDKNRIKETKYQEEKKLLSLTNNNKYEFNACLTSIVESRVEEGVKGEEIHSLKSSNKYDGYVPIDFNSSLNKPSRFIRKHRIVYSTTNKKYAIPPDGGEYIPYEKFIKIKTK